MNLEFWITLCAFAPPGLSLPHSVPSFFIPWRCRGIGLNVVGKFAKLNRLKVAARDDASVKILLPHSNYIAAIDAVNFSQGQIVKHGDPVIVPEHPWEGVLTYLYGSVVKTTIYKMWYQAGGVYVGYA